jgi:hypothetical protein
MSQSTRFAFASLATMALVLLLAVDANAEQLRYPARQKTRDSMQPMPSTWNAVKARAAHPITQGGTTGGEVNPALTGDGMHHGYNG